MDEPKDAIAPESGQEHEVSVEELKAQLEQARKSQAGVDKSYAEAAKKAAALQAEVENLKKEKMTEKERAEFEFAKQKAELEAKSREVAEATLRLSKVRLMGEKGIDLEYSDYITGNSDEEIRASIDTFNKRLEALVAKRVDEKLIGTSKPKAGEAPAKVDDLKGKSLRDIEKLAREGKL